MPRTNPKLNVGPAEDRIRRIVNFYYLNSKIKFNVVVFNANIFFIFRFHVKIKKNCIIYNRI